MVALLHEKLALRDRMLAIFSLTAKDRSKRPDIVRVEKTLPFTGRVIVDHDPAWAIHEREVMLDAVNEERLQRGLQPATMTMIERADRQAGGHIDYARKFALYCTEIALGEDAPQP